MLQPSPRLSHVATGTRRVAIMMGLDQAYKRHTDVFYGAQRYGAIHGWDIQVAEFADHDLAEGNLPAFDGIIARANEDLAERAAERGVALVNVWVDTPVPSLPSVFPDLKQQGIAMAEHLLSRGYQRFALLTVESSRAHCWSAEGFLHRLNEAGCPCETASLPLHYPRNSEHWQATERIMADWVASWKSQGPIGVFLSIDALARRLLGLCEQQGLRVPHDVGLITSMNEEHYCQDASPTLSSVELGYDRIGYEAARLLDEMMNGAAPPPRPMLMKPVSVVPRESTDFFAVADSVVSRAQRYIAENCHHAIAVDDIAHFVNASRSTLQRRFRQHLSRSVAAEVRRMRTEKLKQELAITNRPIKQIALATGFDNVQRLDEFFRREVGLSPSDYRKQVTIQDGAA